LQGKTPKEIDAILTGALACFLPGRAKDLSAPPVLSTPYLQIFLLILMSLNRFFFCFVVIMKPTQKKNSNSQDVHNPLTLLRISKLIISNVVYVAGSIPDGVIGIFH